MSDQNTDNGREGKVIYRDENSNFSNIVIWRWFIYYVHNIHNIYKLIIIKTFLNINIKVFYIDNHKKLI